MGAMGAVQGGMMLLGTYQNWKAQRDQAKETARALSKQASAVGKNLAYAFQNYELQRVDAFDSAVNSLMKTQQQSLALTSGVRAAVNEETGGDSRTGRALQRVSNADVLRTMSSIKDNYTRQSDEIDLNKEAEKRQAIDEINNIKSQAPTMPTVWSLVGQVAGKSLGIYNSYQNAKEAAASQGMKLDTWWRAKNPETYTANRYHFDIPTYSYGLPSSYKYMDYMSRYTPNRYHFAGMPTFTTYNLPTSYSYKNTRGW